MNCAYLYTSIELFQSAHCSALRIVQTNGKVVQINSKKKKQQYVQRNMAEKLVARGIDGNNSTQKRQLNTKVLCFEFENN